jgi:hypothetical protein
MPTYAIYSTGTLSVTNGSNAVTGTSTVFSDINASAGSIITIAGVPYTIASRNSATSLTLADAYAGNTASGVAYYVDHIKNPLPLTANETVTVNAGVTLEITNKDWGVLNHSTFTVNGTFFINVPEYNDFVRVWRSGHATDAIVVGGAGTLKTRGKLISFATGTGEAAQKYRLPIQEVLSTLWVETGNNTGVFEKYLSIDYNVTSAMNNALLASLSLAGSGELGRFFSQRITGTINATSASATITGNGTLFTTELQVGDTLQMAHLPRIIQSIESDTSLTLTTTAGLTATSQNARGPIVQFGDGTNGKCPPSGARIQIPNIILTAGGTIGTIANGIAGSAVNNGGVIDMHCVIFPRGFFRNANWTSFYLKTCCSAYSINTVSGGFLSSGTVEDFGAVLNNESFPGNQFKEKVTIKDCFIASAATQAIAVTSACGVAEIVGGFFFTSSSNSLACGVAAAAITSTVKNCICVPVIRPAGTCLIDGVRLSGSLLQNSPNRSAIAGSTFVERLTIKNVSLFSGGYSTAALFDIAESIKYLEVFDCDFSGVSSPVFIQRPGVQYSTSSFSIYNCNLGTLQIFSGSNLNQSAPNSKYINLLGAANLSNTIPESKTLFCKVPLSDPSIPTPTSSVFKRDMILVDGFYPDDPSLGALFFYFFGALEYTDKVLLEGRAYSLGVEGYQLSNLGDAVTLISPFKIYGVTGFRNTDFGISGAANILYQYSLDTGSGWSEWNGLTPANISQEVVSATDGFYMKIKAYPSVASTGTSNQVKILSIRTTRDNSVNYPVSFASITLDNVVPGSRYFIFETANPSVVLASGVASAETVTSDVVFSGDKTVTIRVRNASGTPKYQPFTTQAALTSAGASVYVSQLEDTVA